MAEDAVLQDQTGFHLGAGPYMLFYSRAVDEEALAYNWPEFLKVKLGYSQNLAVD